MKLKAIFARVLALILILTVAVSIVACSQASSSTPNASGNNDNVTTGTEEPGGYMLSGVWKFNDTIEPYNLTVKDETTTYEGVSERIHFTSNGKKYNTMDWMWTKVTTIDLMHTNITYYNTDTSYPYLCYQGQWESEEDRIVDFGTEPQEVYENFYNWFTKNAKKVS